MRSRWKSLPSPFETGIHRSIFISFPDTVSLSLITGVISVQGSGYAMDDVMLFQQIDGDRIDLSFGSIPIEGPSLGLDLAYSPPIGLDIDISGGVGITGGIYRKEAGVQLSYNLGAINLGGRIPVERKNHYHRRRIRRARQHSRYSPLYRPYRDWEKLLADAVYSGLYTLPFQRTFPRED